jgi:hypothetical protein
MENGATLEAEVRIAAAFHEMTRKPSNEVQRLKVSVEVREE